MGVTCAFLLFAVAVASLEPDGKSDSLKNYDAAEKEFDKTDLLENTFADLSNRRRRPRWRPRPRPRPRPVRPRPRPVPRPIYPKPKPPTTTSTPIPLVNIPVIVPEVNAFNATTCCMTCCVIACTVDSDSCNTTCTDCCHQCKADNGMEIAQGRSLLQNIVIESLKDKILKPDFEGEHYESDR